MSKPIDEAIKLKGICRFCKILNPRKCGEKGFECERADLGKFDDFCTKEDYLACPFNKVRMREMPERKSDIVADPRLIQGTPENMKMKSSSYIDDLKKLEFQTEGEFFTACHKYFKLVKSQVEPHISSYDLSKIEQRKFAWLNVIAHYKEWMRETKR